jgi:hypothetical protein
MMEKRSKGKERKRRERMRRRKEEDNNLRGKDREWDNDNEHKKVLIVNLHLTSNECTMVSSRTNKSRGGVSESTIIVMWKRLTKQERV